VAIKFTAKEPAKEAPPAKPAKTVEREVVAVEKTVTKKATRTDPPADLFHADAKPPRKPKAK
jgi:hypothetical protein